jgi:hypothetical protein
MGKIKKDPDFIVCARSSVGQSTGFLNRDPPPQFSNNPENINVSAGPNGPERATLGRYGPQKAGTTAGTGGSIRRQPRQLSRIKNPLCAYQTHCGHEAVLGDPVDLGGCINTSITCVHCGVTGVRSENTEARGEAWHASA